MKQRRILQNHVEASFWKEGKPLEKYIVTKHFRCTKEEADLISEKAQKERKPVSAYLRDAALNRNLPVMDPKIEPILQKLQENELKIGVNINQAVRLCNAKKNVSRSDYETLTGYLKEIMKQRKELTGALIRLSER